MFIKGKAAVLHTGTMTFSAPNTMTMSGLTIWGQDPTAQMVQYNGTLTYAPKLTVTANFAGNDIDAAVTTLKTLLVAKGYLEIGSGLQILSLRPFPPVVSPHPG